jgi:hypothetical protein
MKVSARPTAKKSRHQELRRERLTSKQQSSAYTSARRATSPVAAKQPLPDWQLMQIAVHCVSSCLPAALCIHGLINNNKLLDK